MYLKYILISTVITVAKKMPCLVAIPSQFWLATVLCGYVFSASLISKERGFI